MKKCLLIIIFLSFFISLFAQDDKNFPSLTESDIPGGKISESKYYGGDALWGLIDGGADIYLEYGFDKLLFQEIEWRGLKFRAEFYRMNDAKSAFGIFSISRYKCKINDTLTKYICITPFQIQAALGKFYISISNEKGNKEAQQLTLEIFSKYIRTVNEIPFELPDFLQKDIFEPYKNQTKLMKGRLGLQNGFPMWLELFDEYSDYEIYLIPIEEKTGYAYVSQIIFSNEKDQQKFISENSTSTKGITKFVKSISPKEVLFFESSLPEWEIKKFSDLIDNK